MAIGWTKLVATCQVVHDYYFLLRLEEGQMEPFEMWQSIRVFCKVPQRGIKLWVWFWFQQHVLMSNSDFRFKVWKFQFRAFELCVLFCMLDLDFSSIGFKVSFSKSCEGLVKGGEFRVPQLRSNQVLQLRLQHFNFTWIWGTFVITGEIVDDQAWFLSFNENHLDLNSAWETWR